MKNNYKKHLLYPLLGIVFLYNSSCSKTSNINAQSTITSSISSPVSDPKNEGGWILNEEVSDEFNGTSLDTNKWFIEGLNDQYYIWKGRAPAQFVPHNVIVEDGILKLRTQWEPGYDFDNEGYKESGGEPYGVFEGKPLPITTAGVLTKKRFLNGYMEVKSKAGNAAITAAFWAIGYEQELDIYEQMGNPKIKDNDIKETGTKSTIHDWSPPATRPTWTWHYKDNNLPFRVADDFHVYGAEWGEDYLKLFIDGKLVDETHQDELGTEWVLNNPMEVWLDSEIFKWLGIPDKDELPVDFEIEYLRVWQKPSENLLDRQFYGFEGPILFEENPRPLMLLPESSIPDDYQQFWLMDTTSAKYLVYNEGNYSSGVNSLEFTGLQKGQRLTAEKIEIQSPKGAINLPAGKYTLSLKVFLEQGHLTKNIYVGLSDESIEIPIKLAGKERRKWITIEHDFTKNIDSSSDDQFKIEIRNKDIPKDRASKFYIDDIEIKKSKQ